jgi:hypothetical protein
VPRGGLGEPRSAADGLAGLWRAAKGPARRCLGEADALHPQSAARLASRGRR